MVPATGWYLFFLSRNLLLWSLDTTIAKSSAKLNATAVEVKSMTLTRKDSEARKVICNIVGIFLLLLKEDQMISFLPRW